jgi:hypothetical protein
LAQVEQKQQGQELEQGHRQEEEQQVPKATALEKHEKGHGEEEERNRKRMKIGPDMEKIGKIVPLRSRLPECHTSISEETWHQSDASSFSPSSNTSIASEVTDREEDGTAGNAYKDRKTPSFVKFDTCTFMSTMRQITRSRYVFSESAAWPY